MHSKTSALLSAFALSLFLVACGSPDSVGACSAANCNGCCAADGQCLGGDDNAACGASGASCGVCAGNQACVLKACIAPSNAIDAGGTQTDAGTADAGTTPTAIVAPNEAWTWVDFPDSQCGNGATTGIGINPTTRSTDLLIYMQGGGACWNAFTCFTIGSATNITTGYQAAAFATESFKSAWAVNRNMTANPLKDMSYVYVPYCTGDVHAGDSVKTHDPGRPPVHHKGGKNIEAFLRRLKLTFPNATRVFLSGSSAGAYGSQLNYQRALDAFPAAEIHVLADCGQMVNPAGTFLTDWTSAWNMTVPASCTGCDTDFSKYPAWLATTYPNRRFGLLAYTQDNVLRQFFGYTNAAFETETLALMTAKYDPYPNAKYFVLASTDHVMLDNLDTLSAPGNKTLNAFVTGFVQNTSEFANVKP